MFRLLLNAEFGRYVFGMSTVTTFVQQILTPNSWYGAHEASTSTAMQVTCHVQSTGSLLCGRWRHDAGRGCGTDAGRPSSREKKITPFINTRVQWNFSSSLLRITGSNQNRTTQRQGYISQCCHITTPLHLS